MGIIGVMGIIGDMGDMDLRGKDYLAGFALYTAGLVFFIAG